MSTRKILRDRRKYFEFISKKEPENINYQKAIKEINFIFEKLKEYDR